MSEPMERAEERELRRRKVLEMLIDAGGRSVWDGDDSVGWEDGRPRQTIRGFVVGGQLLVMIESEGGLDVLRSINPKNSLDDLGETIARIGRGDQQPEPAQGYLVSAALREDLLQASRGAIGYLRTEPCDSLDREVAEDLLEPIEKLSTAKPISEGADHD
jgi:hypothetical protein